jgi:nucleoside-diphosphate-sugar epimerase
VLGDPDQPRTYTYIPDIGEGLAVLGEHPDAPGEIWHLPNDPATRTTRELVDMIFKLAGQSRSRLRRMPPLLLRSLSLINPSKCSTNSRNRISSTATKSRTSWGSQQLPSMRPSPETLQAYSPEQSPAVR